MQPLITSKRVQIVVGVLIVLILMSLSFVAGSHVSERRLSHFSNWRNNYPGMMGGRWGDRGSMMNRAPMPLPNGVFGRILSATGTTLIIEGQDHFEQNVLVTTSTAIRSDQGTATFQDLRVDQRVSVFGRPTEQGQIEARLIRLLSDRP